MYKLIIEDDEGHTTVVPLVKDEITIGRKEGNTIRLTERNVSRHHARLLRSNGTVFIEDLDSYNGVKVNGGKISARTTIREGDLVEIGDYHLALQQAEEAQAASVDRSAETGGSAQPPPVKAAPPAVPAPTTADGGTAVLRLPIDEKKAPEPGRARPIPDDQAARLVVQSTDLSGQVFALNRTEITIGRTEENDISLPHRSVSSRHAKVVFDGGVYRVIDLDSANGVLVNGEEYARVDIRKGDVIELGHVKLRYLAPGEDPQAAAPSASTPVDAPAAAAPMDSRPLVDASMAEARQSKGGSGKLLGIVIGGGLLVAAGIFAVIHFTSGPSQPETTGPNPTDQPIDKPAVPEGPPVKPDTGPAGPDASPEATAKTEAADYFKQGAEKMTTSDWKLAEQLFQSALRLDPDHKGAQEMLARVIQEKEGATLIEQANKAIGAQDWDEAWDLLSQVPEGTQAAKEAALKKPVVLKRYRGFHLNKAALMEKNGKLKEAIKHLDTILYVDPENYMAKTRKEKLAKRLAAASRKPPRVRKTPEPDDKPEHKKPGRSSGGRKTAKAAELRNQGTEAYKKGNYAQAITSYQKALKANPKDHELHRLLGSVWARMGKRKKAYQAYRKYVQVCPKCMYAPTVRKILEDYEKLQQ